MIKMEFAEVYKGPVSGQHGPEPTPVAKGPSNNGQNVVCTPEVSLYQQYNGPNPNGSIRASVNGDSGVNKPMEISSSGLNLVEPVVGNIVMTAANPTANGFQCGFCGKTFQQKNTFQNHLRSHRDGEDPYQCDICGKTFAVPARLTRHYRTHTGEKPYQCEYCNKSFSVKENLSVHRRIHTKERPYKCEVCERAFEHSGKLHRHMRIHTGERPHRCQLCQKTFIQSGQLVIHMRTHTGEKPYVCKVCNKGFTCSKQLKVHTRTHTGEKPYTCDICGKSFGYNHVLKLHQVAHYGEKVYKCTLCNGTFNSKKALETHIKTHADDGGNSNSTNAERLAHSPTSSILSQTPQHSDKENRSESSDSELSLQNSPPAELKPSPPTSPSSSVLMHSGSLGAPKTSSNSSLAYALQSGRGTVLTKASLLSPSTTIFPINSPPNQQQRHGPHNGNNAESLQHHHGYRQLPASTADIPYPMLPPGVEVHQAPQSKTTFLYVTSKLPVVSTNSNSNTNSSNNNNNTISSSNLSSIIGSTKGEVTMTPLETKLSPIRTTGGAYKLFNNGLTTASNNNNSGITISPSVHSSPTNSSAKFITNSSSSEKLLLQSASIREKVLAFTEKFGYGLDSGEHRVVMNGTTQNSFTKSGNNNNYPTNLSSYGKRLLSGPEQYDLQYGEEKCGTMGRKLSSGSTDSGCSSGSSPTTSSYTPGGVLALALTRGSKAVNKLYSVSSSTGLGLVNHSNNNNNTVGNHKYGGGMIVRPGSPELSIDLSQHSSSCSNSSSCSGTRSPPRSDTPYNDQDSSDELLGSSGGRKRCGSDLSGGGAPRKRSSMILEKYAQEKDPSASKGSDTSTTVIATTNATTTDGSKNGGSSSILSQRLRLSSVIQYAEKCS